MRTIVTIDDELYEHALELADQRRGLTMTQ